MDWASSTPTWIEIWEGYLRSKESQTYTRPPGPGFQCQEDNSPQLLAAKIMGIESVEEADGAISSYSWGTHTQTHLLRLTPSKFQHQGDSFKGTGGI